MAIRTIAVGISGNGEEQHLVTHSVELAAQLGARLVFVHINDPKAGGVSLYGIDHGHKLDVEVLTRYVESEGSLDRWPSNAEVRIETGDWLELLGTLSQEVDLLAVGHRHMGWFKSVFTDSGDEAVVERAGCPVLVVP